MAHPGLLGRWGCRHQGSGRPSPHTSSAAGIPHPIPDLGVRTGSQKPWVLSPDLLPGIREKLLRGVGLAAGGAWAWPGHSSLPAASSPFSPSVPHSRSSGPFLFFQVLFQNSCYSNSCRWACWMRRGWQLPRRAALSSSRGTKISSRVPREDGKQAAAGMSGSAHHPPQETSGPPLTLPAVLSRQTFLISEKHGVGSCRLSFHGEGRGRGDGGTARGSGLTERGCPGLCNPIAWGCTSGWAPLGPARRASLECSQGRSPTPTALHTHPWSEEQTAAAPCSPLCPDTWVRTQCSRTRMILACSLICEHTSNMHAHAQTRAQHIHAHPTTHQLSREPAFPCTAWGPLSPLDLSPALGPTPCALRVAADRGASAPATWNPEIISVSHGEGVSGGLHKIVN
ncbi:PREDICTED: uncharacterized protein LOC106723724 [Myotis brandtii]|uniref:uncharacterized protein LOC106723724 n=1 Tax=Myotis brandtii TaxID=109478 RepID=UPI00070412C6|nr:PREDICTED: uncharacterized protein LOC106723724 [Myotis brandtii]